MPLALLGDRSSFYEDLMVGCAELHGEEACLNSEQNRLKRSRIQPLAVVNYTAVGYAKVSTPASLFRMIKDFWNKNRQKLDTESWDSAVSYTYVCTIASPQFTGSFPLTVRFRQEIIGRLPQKWYPFITYRYVVVDKPFV